MTFKKVTRKILLMFLACLLASLNAYAYEGLMSGQKNLSCIKTEFFDIIYPESSKESAAELAVHADDIYREICADYGITPSIRMPVTITGATDAYNAYFTTFTYNHIVLYDTSPDESMSVFESNICDTFRHELTHALTINMKNPFWSFVAKVFGDPISTGDYLNMTTAIKEGAAVAEESRGGFGRLNNPYYMQTVRQAKIQGSFPSQADVEGARDIYPGGNMSYAFGGPFTKWLQDKYGMEKYAEFWYAGINTHSVTYQLVFRKVYGISVNTAWKEFYQSIYVPENVIQPDDEKSIQTVPYTSERGYLYSSLSSGGDKIVWLEEKTSTVWMSRSKDDGGMTKPKKFLVKDGISSISLSRDGRYLALTYYSPNAAQVSSHVEVYDTERKNHVRIKDRSLKNAFVVQTDGDYFLCAVKSHGQNESLVQYKIIESQSGKSTRMTGLEEKANHDFARGESLYSPLDFGQGRIACIFKSQGKSKIRIFDSDMNYREIDLSGKGIFIQGLSLQDGESLIFSWAGMDTLPRLGRLTLSDKSALIELDASDISGGVYGPVSFNGKYFYTGNFVDRTRLFMRDQGQVDFEKSEAGISFTAAGQNDGNDRQSFDADEVLSSAEKWDTVFYGKGITAPLSLIQEYSQNGEADELIFLGLTWITSNPWDGKHFALGGGIKPWGNKKGGLMALIRGGGESSLFNYQIVPTVLFNGGGFLQATISSTFSAGISLNNYFYLLARDESLLFLGHQEAERNGSYENAYGMMEHTSGQIDPAFYLSFYNSLGIQLSTMRQMGLGRYSTGGVSFQLNYDMRSNNTIDEAEGFNQAVFMQNLYPALSVAFPRLLPFEGSSTMTYNLPLKISAYFAPTDEILLAATASTVLFSAEIQKGLTFFPLYFNTITVSGEYKLNLIDRNSNVSLLNMISILRNNPLSYRDSVSLTATVSGVLNSGIFATPSMVQTFGIKFTYYPRDTSSRPYAFSFVTSLNF